MALISCHECGHRVSTEAAACPGCGAPPRQVVESAPPPPITPVLPAASLATAPSAGSEGEPGVAWVVWAFGGILVLICILAIAGFNSPPIAEGAAADGDRQSDNGRAEDSVSVLALARADTSMPRDQLLALESTLHLNRFTVSHNAAHQRYSRIMLDSADALIEKGLTFQARGILSAATSPMSKADSSRAGRLNTRITAVEEEQARESTRLRREADAQVMEDRVTRIRGLDQGECTPPTRAVRNRLRKNPEWSDEMIATTACSRVHIGMTREQAIAAWGRPRDINRTTHSFGVHEQWVYGEYGSGYLYFEDGVLTTIQN
jgi:hypothetical protein